MKKYIIERSVRSPIGIVTITYYGKGVKGGNWTKDKQLALIFYTFSGANDFIQKCIHRLTKCKVIEYMP